MRLYVNCQQRKKDIVLRMVSASIKRSQQEMLQKELQNVSFEEGVDKACHLFALGILEQVAEINADEKDKNN